MSVSLSPPPVAPGQPIAPAPKPKPSAWRLLSRSVVGLFAVLGAIGTVITIYTFLAPASDEQRILARSVDHGLAYRSRTFPMDVTVDGIDAGNEDLLQTDLTLWRDGGKPITADMVRRPLRVIIPSGSRIVTFKVVSKESSVLDNFKVDRDGNDVLVRWKVFDPDMALKLAIVRSGSSIDVRVSSDEGPDIVVTASRFSGLKRLELFALTLILAVFVCACIGMECCYSSFCRTGGRRTLRQA